MNIYSIIVLLYFFLIVSISFVTKKIAQRSSADYLIAGRNLGTFVCAVVVAAEWLGGMSTIGISEKAFKTMTLQPILYNFATATGMIIIGFTVAYHYRTRNVHTVSEMLKSIFGDQIAAISAFAFLIAYIVLSYVQLQTCASVISPILKIDWTLSVIISAVIITLYTYVGGMYALTITGIVHLVAMYFGLGLATIIGIYKVGGFANLHNTLQSFGAPTNLYNPFSGNVSAAFSLLLGGVLGGMAGQASIQPIFSAKDPQTAKKAAVLSGIIVAPFGIMTGLLGLMARTGKFFDPSTIKGNEALGTILTTPSFINPILGGIALAGVIAAILSTVGPVNFAVVTIATKDIYQNFSKKGKDDSKILETAKNLVVLINLITIPLALLLRNAILDTAYISYAIRGIGAIVIIFALYFKGLITKTGVKLSFIGGVVVIFLCLLGKQMKWFDIDKTYGAIVSTLIFIAIGYIWDKLIMKKSE
uniref:Sodium:solute symporter family protein n=1 Tax=candidate division WOR-3 bacterium TaxID=2052148 RepID=A0A7C3N8P2_UNCW3